MSEARKDQGFTLIEVLAALLVFSLSIIGLTQAGTQSARTTGVLQDRMLAGIVADNQMVEARIGPLKTGLQSGTETQMAREFSYVRDIEGTDLAGFFRITVTVTETGKEQVLISRVAYRQGTS